MTPTEQELEQETNADPSWESQLLAVIDQRIDAKVADLQKRIAELEAQLTQE